jgi:hypothetical protein
MSRTHYSGIARHYFRLAVSQGNKPLGDSEIDFSPTLYKAALSVLEQLPDNKRRL